MADKVRKWTDRKLRSMEKKISGIYSEAQDDLVKKWNQYMKRGQKRLADLEQAYSDALLTKDTKAIKVAEKNLINAKKNYTLRNDYYKAMVKSVSYDMAQINQKAVAYLNDEIPKVYTKSYINTMDATNKLYIMRDEHTIKNMITDGDIQLPEKKVNISKDMRWNTKKMNSSVLQGIIQGEDMNTIAKRIMPIVDNNKASAMRNARTMVNGAENRGRYDKYQDLKGDGFLVQKEWIATADKRTRDWHLVMDGQRVDVDDYFIDGNSDKLMYPSDPKAEPRTVYNCRCDMKSSISGFKNAKGEEIYFDDLTEDGVFSRHEEEIINEQVRRFEEYNKKNQDVKILKPNEFKETFDEAKATLPKGGEWRVDDTHTIRDYKNDKLISFKGGSVVAVTPKGDIVSVCKNMNGAERGSDLLKVAVQNGGDRLDAFGSGLYKFYTKNGFEPVSWTRFNEEYAPHDWVKGRDKKEPVVFYRYTGKRTNLKYGDFIKQNKPFKEYDDAMSYRDKLIAKTRKK